MEHEPFEIIDSRKTVVAEEAAAPSVLEVDRVYSDPQPILDRVLVRQGAAETYYAGTRFVIPQTAQQAPNKGVVVQIGPDAGDVCKPGDLVTFSRFNAEPIDIDGETFQLMRKFDIKLVEKVQYAIGV